MRNLIDLILGRLMLDMASNFEEAIKDAKRIKILSLVDPQYNLNDYGNDFLKFVNLKELSIHVRPLYNSKLPSEIGQLKKLKKLHILNYPFVEFPDWLFDLTNLENLMLRGNDIKTIPSRISELTNLKHLRIESTELESIPDTLKSLGNLKTLSVVDNFKLKDIDRESLPPNLKWLALTPSGIPREVINKIEKEMPNLKVGKRYFK